MKSEKISTTAYVIADSLAKLSHVPRFAKYISPEMARLSSIFAANTKNSLAKHFISLLPIKLSVLIMDVFYVPGMTYHYLFRKLLIEKQLKEAIHKDVKQVIILGGGFDTLAIRMAAIFSEINFFEIDLPDTQTAKIRILNENGYAVANNCIFKPADLSTAKLQTILASEHKFNHTKPTLVIIEGVLMYLTEAEVKALFIDLQNLINSHLTIIFGAIAAPDNKNWRMRLIDGLLKRGQESTKWFCSSADMPKFLAELGYSLEEWIPYKKLQSFYRDVGEISNVPEDDENYYVAKTD